MSTRFLDLADYMRSAFRLLQPADFPANDPIGQILVQRSAFVSPLPVSAFEKPSLISPSTLQYLKPAEATLTHVGGDAYQLSEELSMLPGGPVVMNVKVGQTVGAARIARDGYLANIDYNFSQAEPAPRAVTTQDIVSANHVIVQGSSVIEYIPYGDSCQQTLIISTQYLALHPSPVPFMFVSGPISSKAINEIEQFQKKIQTMGDSQ